MNIRSALIYGVALVVIIGVGVFMYCQKVSQTQTLSVSSFAGATPADTPSPTLSPTPTSSSTATPIGTKYLNASLGLSFQFPSGYYVIDESVDSRLEIQNRNQQLTGLPDSTYRDIELGYGSHVAAENGIKAEAGATERNIPVQGTTVRLYIFPNPNNPSFTIADAFWSGKVPFSLSILWDTTTATQADGQQDSDEVALLEEILPTIVVSK